MNNQDIDKLYAQSVKESPSLELDEAILKQAHAQAPKSNLVALFKWQRILSVAAVMVLSIYIFFEVGEHSMNFEGDQLLRGEELLLNTVKSKIKKMKSQTLDEDVIYEMDEFSDLESERQQQQVVPQKDDSVIFSELAAEQSVKSNSYKNLEQTESALSSVKVVSKLAAPLAIQQAPLDQSPTTLASESAESSTPAPNEMISEIEHLIAAGNLVDAKEMYRRLIVLYPDYSIPSNVIRAFE